MKGKFGIAALMFSGITFAAPVSTPNQLSDTPIIAGGGSGGNLSMNNCRAYQTDGASINLSGGETLVFYGSGGDASYNGQFPTSFGGYLATKTTYSGTAYIKVKGGRDAVVRVYSYDGPSYYYYGKAGYAIGLFARNSENKADFIAGAGAGGAGYYSADLFYTNAASADRDLASGGGWAVSGQTCGYRANDIYNIYNPYGPYPTPYRWGYTSEWVCLPAKGGDVSSGWWFSDYMTGTEVFCSASSTDSCFSRTYTYYPTPGFHSGYAGSGGASSISAFYNSYTRDYTSPVNSLTIAKGGFWGLRPPALYVCQ